MRHQKYTPGSIVLLRQMDAQDKVATVWGGQVMRSAPSEITVLAIEMVHQNERWHCVGEFRTIKAPPHRQPKKWWFPRLLVYGEANDIDLTAKPVIEAALQVYRKSRAEAGKS